MKKGFKIAILIILIIAIAVAVFAMVKNNMKKGEIQYTIEKVENYNYFVLKQNNKYGVIDTKGEIVIEAKYTNVVIPNPEKEVFICYDNDKPIALNSKGETIFNSYQNVQPIRLQNVASDLMYEKSTLKYEQNGKFGLINLDGKKITESKYDSIEAVPCQEGKMMIKRNGKMGLINIKGYEIINCEYDKIDMDGYYEDDGDYNYAGYIVSNTTNEGYRYGYINYLGEKIVEPECNQLERVTEIQDKDNVYLILAKNGQYGVYKNKDEIIKKEYQSIRYEKGNEVFVIEKSKEYGVMNKKNETVLPLQYDQIDITGIYIYAKKGEETEVYNKYGQRIEVAESTSIINTSNNKYKIKLVSDDDVISYGIIDEEGNEIISNDEKYKYIDTELLSNKYFIVSNKDGKLGIIDERNNQVLKFAYTSIQKVDNTNIIVATSTDENITQFYSSELEKICEMSIAKTNVENNYICALSKDDRKYININTQQEEANTTVYQGNKLFAKKENGLWGFMDKSGNVKIQCQFEKVTEFNKFGYAGIKKDGKWGIIDSDANIILNPIYVISEDDEINLDFIGKYYGIKYHLGEVYYTDQNNSAMENVED